MALPAGYIRNPWSIGYIRLTDGAGPFSLAEAVPSGAWIQEQTGAWYRADGSGPYSRDIGAGTATLMLPEPA